MIWEVGNGENISHWKDRWLHSDSMRSLLVGPLPPNSDEINLANITIHNRGELEQAINFQIPDDIFTRIESINLSTSEDFNFTTWTKRGSFDGAKARECLISLKDPLQSDLDQLSWDNIWKSNTYPKIKLFL